MKDDEIQLIKRVESSNSFQKQALDTIVELEEIKTQLKMANNILRNNLEWVRCGIGGNCSGYPKDHPDYLLQLNYLEAFNETS